VSSDITPLENRRSFAHIAQLLLHTLLPEDFFGRRAKKETIP
jgi:hypothetical protein